MMLPSISVRIFSAKEPIVSILSPKRELAGLNETKSRVRYRIFLLVGTMNSTSSIFPSLNFELIKKSISILSM